MLASPELIAEAALPDRLAEVLPRYLRQVPLYRQWQRAPVATLEQLQQLPLMTKADIRRDFPRNFLGPAADLESLLDEKIVELEHTSGTSEQRTPLLLPYGWWARQELRALRLNPFVADALNLACSSGRQSAPSLTQAPFASRTLDGLETSFPGPRRVTISSPTCSSEICYTGVPSRDERIVGNTLFLSLSRYPFLWSEADLARMAEEALEWQPVFLDVDPVYGTVFALYCERQGIRLPGLKFILCSYEFVSVNHRRILQRVFGVPVFNLYGSTETGHLLMEDLQGQLHPSQETAFFEVLEAEADGIGQLVLTTLTNDFMPLVRYRIGDLVEPVRGPDGTHYVLHGRAADALRSASGRRVTPWQLDQCFAGLPGVAHYQLVKPQGRGWRLRYLPDPGASPGLPQEPLRQRLADLLELNGPLQLEATELFVPEGSGKFRLT